MSRDADTAPHALIVLLGEGDSSFSSVWRDEVPETGLQAGDLLPLPDAAVEAAGDHIEPAGLVESLHAPSHLPEAVKALLTGPPEAECRIVVVLRVLQPEVTEDGFVSLGDYDPADARQLLQLLEEHEVPFEIEADHSALLQPGRAVALYMGMSPPGSRMHVLVPLAHLGHARKLLRWLYPPEKAPASFRTVSTGAVPPPVPSMEVYTPPAAEISWEQRRDFYTKPPPESGSSPPDGNR